MEINRRKPSIHSFIVLFMACLVLPCAVGAQTYGALTGIVKDEHGVPISGAAVRISSPDLIGGVKKTTTDDDGRFGIRELSPGTYVLELMAELAFEKRFTWRRASPFSAMLLQVSRRA